MNPGVAYRTGIRRPNCNKTIALDRQHGPPWERKPHWSIPLKEFDPACILIRLQGWGAH